MIDKYNKAKRNCIVISLDEFEQILDELAYSNDLNLDRLTYSCMKEDYDNEINLYPLFEKYFDIIESYFKKVKELLDVKKQFDKAKVRETERITKW